MDIWHTCNGIRFVWNAKKAADNVKNHGIIFEKACEVFFDPFIRVVNASRKSEERTRPSATRKTHPCCYALRTLPGKTMPSESSQLGKHCPTKGKFMKISDLKKRLAKDRPMTTISMRIPEDVVEDLKRIAPLLGFSGYQPLIRAYIGQGLRADLAKLEQERLPGLVESLKRHGVSEEVITEAIAESKAA